MSPDRTYQGLDAPDPPPPGSALAQWIKTICPPPTEVPLLKSFFIMTTMILGSASLAQAGGDICDGLFKTNKFVIFQNERGKPAYLEGQEGSVTRVRFDVQPHANRGLSMLWTGGTDVGGQKYENNFMVPAKLPAWGLMQQKYEGFPDKMIDVFFASPEKAVKKEISLEELLEPGP